MVVILLSARILGVMGSAILLLSNIPIISFFYFSFVKDNNLENHLHINENIILIPFFHINWNFQLWKWPLTASNCKNLLCQFYIPGGDTIIQLLVDISLLFWQLLCNSAESCFRNHLPSLIFFNMARRDQIQRTHDSHKVWRISIFY